MELIRDHKLDLAAFTEALQAVDGLWCRTKFRSAVHEKDLFRQFGEANCPVNRRIAAAGDHQALAFKIRAALHQVKDRLAFEVLDSGKRWPVRAKGAAACGNDDRLGIEILYGGAALVATVFAGQQLLIGVEGIGTAIGLSVVFMGLITGVGTSLPELSAAVAASRRGQSDLVLGNVLGSNLFNSLGVAGLAIVIQPGPVSSLGSMLIVIMVGAAVFAGVFAATSQRITRLEGLILVTLFAGYVVMAL
jgi:Ca2+/Na+ antiporter